MTKSGFVNTLRIIWFALIQGVMMASAIFWFISDGKKDGSEILSYIGAGVGGVAVVMHVVVPLILRASAVRSVNKTAFEDTPDDEKWQMFAGPYRAGEIVALAMLEGAAFVNLLMWYLSGADLSLIILGALVALMFIRCPTVGKLDRWIETQCQLMQLKT